MLEIIISLRCKDENRGYERVSGALPEVIDPYSTELSLCTISAFLFLTVCRTNK